jgi:2-haloacid dehalogenase
MTMKTPPAALLFDVFGTVVDWRGSIAREVRRLGARKRVRERRDWGEFADAWRRGYAPAMQRVRAGELPWQSIDALHRMILDAILPEFGLRLTEREKRDLNLVWHRLAPWRDSVPGLTRLKRRHIIGTLSNGNVRLLVDMARHARLPWDCVLSAELFRHYKPDSEVYLGAAALLGLAPREVMLVAAHKDDLAAARRCGLRTAFVRRPLERGPRATSDLADDRHCDYNADDFVDLARHLGC